MARRSPSSSRRARAAHRAGASLLMMLGASCVDPGADYQAFAARPFARRDAAAAQPSDMVCAQLLTKDLNGTYFGSCLSIDLMTAFALAVEQTVTPSADATTATLQLSFTPLAEGAVDISQTAGPVYVLSPTTISSECLFDQPVGDLTLTESGREVTAEDLRLRGRLLGESRSCALLSGTVQPLNLALYHDEDVCVFVRWDTGAPLPELAIPGDYGCDPSGLPALDGGQASR